MNNFQGGSFGFKSFLLKDILSQDLLKTVIMNTNMNICIFFVLSNLTRPSKMGIQHRDPSGTTCVPGHMERFEQREKKISQKKIEPQKQGVSFFCRWLSRLQRSGRTYAKCIFPDVSSIFDRFGILDHQGTFFYHFRPSWTISDHLGPFQTALYNFKPSWTISEHCLIIS